MEPMVLSFFAGFALGGLAMGEVIVGGSLGKGPLVAAVCIYEQELGMRVQPAVADGCHLQRQSELGPACGRHAMFLIVSLQNRYFRIVKCTEKWGRLVTGV